jgi:hypothetical protein
MGVATMWFKDLDQIVPFVSGIGKWIRKKEVHGS